MVGVHGVAHRFKRGRSDKAEFVGKPIKLLQAVLWDFHILCHTAFVVNTCHSVTDLETLHILSNFYDFTGKLVADNSVITDYFG